VNLRELEDKIILMNTKILLTASSFFLGAMGIGSTFIPQEILAYLNLDTSSTITILIQILGALMLGFAIMNWMAREALFGGIYNKPMTIGNFMHFGVGALALVKAVVGVAQNVEVITSLTIIYSIFALCFAYVFMNNPKSVLEK
jgi:hypothetical protein